MPHHDDLIFLKHPSDFGKKRCMTCQNIIPCHIKCPNKNCIRIWKNIELMKREHYKRQNLTK